MYYRLYVDRSIEHGNHEHSASILKGYKTIDLTFQANLNGLRSQLDRMEFSLLQLVLAENHHR